MNKSLPDLGIQPYESYISIFYKLMRCRYAGQAQILTRYGISKNAHAFPFCSPRWLLEVVGAPADHLPSTYCPASHVVSAFNQIKFCPQCMQHGYHSVFCMIKSVDSCFIHKCKLINMCRRCKDRFLGVTALDSYFECPIDLGRIDVLCSACEISWPDWCEGFPFGRVDEFNVGGDCLLNDVSNWYRAVLQGYTESSQLSKLYYSSTGDRNLTIGPLESKYNLLSAESVLAGIAGKASNIYWINFSNSLPICEIHSSQYHRLRSLSSKYCEDIKRKYLACHEECCSSINAITEYSPAQDRHAAMCLPALAYILLRLKLACAIWPTPSSVSGERSCFDNLFRFLEPDIPPLELRSLITFVFLKIMGEIEYHVSKGQCMDILLRSDLVTADLFYLRRTSYASRVACLADWGIERPCRLSVSGATKKLSLIWEHDQSQRNLNFII